MWTRLLALFLIVPMIELALLIQLGGAVGTLPTIGLVIVTEWNDRLLRRRSALTNAPNGVDSSVQDG